MKKLFTFAAAMLASFSLWAATETHPSGATKDTDVSGVSYTIPGIYIAGEGGTKAGDMQTKGVKFRLSNKVDKTNKGFYFKVNEGYKITEVAFCGHVNDNSKTSTLTSVMVDGVSINYAPVDLPNKTTSKTFTVSGFEALDSVVFVFEGDGTQANLEYTVTYEEASTKTVVSSVDTLTAVTINDYPLAPADFTTLATTHTLILEDSAYLIAPVVKFTKHTVITYDDESTKEKDEVIEKTSQQAQASLWGATVDIAGVAYTVYTMKPESYTVTYKMAAGLEDIVLGTEIVKAGTSPKEYAQYEVRPLCTFNAWYDSSYLEKVDLSTVVVNSDMSFYADFSKAYATSLNIEQLVLDYGTTANIDSILTAQGFGFEKIDALDTLNDLEKKDNRNYAFLGLKLKTAGAYVACNIQAGTEISVKFGNVGDSLKIGVNGKYSILPKGYADILTYKAEAEAYLEIITLSKSTVVLKQIMINDTIADVTLPAPGAYPIALSAENGKLEAAWEGKTDKKVNVPVGATVTLTATPDEGYKLVDIKVNGVSLNAVEDVYSFTMPAEEVTVAATFESEAGEKDTDATIKSLTINGVAVTAVENVYAYEVPANENIAQVEVVYELNSAKATATPASGFKVDVPAADAAANTQVITVTAENGDKAEYTVSVTRAASEAIDNTSVTEKAVKVIRNGQLIIEKNGVRYNVLGAVVR